MKKTLKICFNVCTSLVIFSCIIFFVYKYISNKKNESELLSIANNLVNENVITGNKNISSDEECKSLDTEKEENDRKVIGKIIINGIKLNAPIVDGVSQDVLKIAVGHFQETSYWNGNVCLASHNRGSYAHYFEKINQLNIGDEIKYQTKFGTRIYIVSEINNIDENDLSVLGNTKENTITLITCVKSRPELRVCVKGVEKILQ